MAIIVLMTHVPGVKDIMRTDFLDLNMYLLVAGTSIFPFIVHEVAKVVFFERFNFSVYDLYKYEYSESDTSKKAEERREAQAQEEA